MHVSEQNHVASNTASVEYKETRLTNGLCASESKPSTVFLLSFVAEPQGCGVQTTWKSARCYPSVRCLVDPKKKPCMFRSHCESLCKHL